MPLYILYYNDKEFWKWIFSVSDAVKKLGIYNSEAEALDALDGKKDGKINKDIWSQAEDALNNAKPTEDENAGVFEKLPPAVRAVARSLAERMGLDSYCTGHKELAQDVAREAVEDLANKDVDTFKDDYDERLSEALSPHEKMVELQEEITEYLMNHGGKLDGFKFTDVPKGISNVKVNYDEYYGNTENDELTFDADGNGIITKVVDGISIEISYKHNGKDYSIGGHKEGEITSGEDR